jgi:hypothetical protein
MAQKKNSGNNVTTRSHLSLLQVGAVLLTLDRRLGYTRERLPLNWLVHFDEASLHQLMKGHGNSI